jgi:ammonium transporter, Amt family
MHNTWRTRTRPLLVATLAGVLLLALGAPAHAQDVGAAAAQLDLNVVFFLVCMVLVFLMHPGFAMLEAGMTGSRNAANIMMKNMFVVCIAFIAYYLVGWGLHYGASAGGFVGTDQLFIVPGTWAAASGADGFLASELMFDAVFAATAATIISGAVAGRMNLWGFLILATLMTAVIYPIIGHWGWGGGWLEQLGFADFAGSTIVHLTGGVAGITAAAILGPRVGKYTAAGKPRPIFGHSAPLATLGVFMLFFGWFGFNGGSVLNAEVAVGPVLLTTALAASTGGLTAAAISALRGRGKTDLTMTGNGILAGLVGITAGADVVAPWAALLVGVVAGVLVTVAVLTVERLGVDDAVGAFSVHGVCGVLGTWWVGLFAVGDGLLYGGGFTLLGVHMLGTVAVALFVVATVGPICLALRAARLLRIPDEVQAEGLDVHEHGVAGYPEPVAVGAGPNTGS